MKLSYHIESEIRLFLWRKRKKKEKKEKPTPFGVNLMRSIIPGCPGYSFGLFAINLNFPLMIKSKSWLNTHTMTDNFHTSLRQKPAFVLVVSAYVIAVLAITIMFAIMWS